MFRKIDPVSRLLIWSKNNAELGPSCAVSTDLLGICGGAGRKAEIAAIHGGSPWPLPPGSSLGMSSWSLRDVPTLREKQTTHVKVDTPQQLASD